MSHPAKNRFPISTFPYLNTIWRANSYYFYLTGISCGSYTTNTAATLKYLCEHAPLDLLVIQDRQLLDNLIQDEPELSEIVKSFILIDETGHSIGKNNILTWQELLENGRNIPDSILKEKEEEQAVNQACMLIYTSGTTGLPKGNNKYTRDNFFTLILIYLLPAVCIDSRLQDHSGF